MLNLKDLCKKVEVIVPIKDNFFLYNCKRYDLICEPGWYLVSIKGNKANIIEQAYDFSRFQKIKGYTFNNNIIFQNRDVAKRKYNFQMVENLFFNNAPTFSSIEAVVWEDNKVYYCGINYLDILIYKVKECYDQDFIVTQKFTDKGGLTPELKTLYLFHAIEKENLRKKEFEESLPQRIKRTFKMAGADVLDMSFSGKRVVVEWCFKFSSFKYNSVINSENFRVIEAGYCLSGEDKLHNITSIVKLAEDYEERGVTYITRN